MTDADEEVRLGKGRAFKWTILSALTILDSLMTAATDTGKPPEL